MIRSQSPFAGAQASNGDADDERHMMGQIEQKESNSKKERSEKKPEKCSCYRGRKDAYGRDEDASRHLSLVVQCVGHLQVTPGQLRYGVQPRN